MSNFNAREYVNRKYNNSDEKGQKTTQPSKSNRSNVFDARTYIAQKHLNPTINLDTLQSDLTSLSKTIDSVYNGWQSRETMENTRSSLQSMYDRLGKYQEYQKQYGGTDLSELQSSYKSVLDSWEDISNKYGQYESADAYNKGISTLKELGTMTSSDIESKLTEITDLEGILKTAKEYESKISGIRNRGNTWEHRSRGLKTDGGYADKLKVAEDELNKYLKDVGYKSVEDIEKTLSGKRIAYTTVGGENILWNSLYDKKKEQEESDAQYKEVSSKDDFGKYKDIGANIENPTYEDAVNGIWIGEWNPFAEKINNPVEWAFANEDDLRMSMLGGAADEEKLSYVKMTDQERDIYNYYLGREKAGLEKEGRAEEYLKSLGTVLIDRLHDETKQNYLDFMDEHPVWGSIGGSVLSVGLNLLAPAEHIMNTYDYAKTGELKKNYTSDLSNTIRGAVSEQVDWEIGNWDAFDFLYNTGMSMADSVVAMATLGNMGGVSLGFSAAAQGTNDALERGLDNKSAFLSGLSAGVFEGVFESLSIGKFKALKDAPVDSVKTIIKNVGKSMLTNASEETLTELANLTYDYIANGDLSQAKTKIRAYVNAGMTEKEATRKVALEQAAQVGEAGLSGALMGIGFGGFGGAVAYSNSKHMGQTIKANERVGEVFDIASNPEVASAYDTYTQYANKGINADNISDAQLGRLYTEARADAVETLKSKKTNAEQKKGAMQTLAKLSVVETENVIKKEAKKFNVGEETKVTGSDETVDVKDLKVKGEEVIVVTEKGKLSVDDITLTQSDAELVAFAKEISKADGEDVANLFISQYDGQTDVYEYANSFNLTMAYAKNNFRYDTILNKKGALSTEAVNTIYQETRIKADKERAKYIKKLNEKMADKKFYKGFIDDAIIDYENTSAEGKVNWNDLDVRQKQAVTFIKGFAQATGMNLVLEHNPDGKYNGKFEVNSNTITIDISNPGKVYQLRETIIPTMSHETTHWMKEKSPELYRHLNEIVFSTLAEHYNSNTEQAIKDKIELLKWADPEKAYTEETAKERTITEEDIIRAEVQKKGKSLDESRDEIIARACEDVLAMSERGKRIFNSLSKTDRKTLVEKLKGLVDDLLNWVNDLLNSYESTSTEARIMREYKEQLQKAAKVWDEMLGKSIKANQSLEKSGKYGHETSAEGDVVYALREEAISEVEQAISNKNYDKEIKLTDSSPAILVSQKGVRNLPMMMIASHIRENILTEKEARALGLKVNSGINYHGLGKTLFLKVIDGLDNVTEAYRGTKNAEDTSRRENYFLLISQYKDSDSNTINIPVYINEKGRYNKIFIDTNKIATVFGRDELRKYIKNQISNGNLVRIKNRSTQASESQSPIDSDYSKNASNSSIPNSNEKVNTKFLDRDYSYESLVPKDDMEVTALEKVTPSEVQSKSIKANQSLEKSGKFVHDASVEGEVKFSEREIIGVSGKNYGIGVYLDSNLLTDLTENERREMVKEFVVTELAGQHFIAYDNNNAAVEIGIADKNARVKNAKGRSKRVVEELYRKNIDTSIKQEAVVLADELIQTAKYKNSLASTYSHDWLDNNGKNDWDYWKVYIQEKNKSVWEATLNIANTANGEKVLYDIDPIKMVEQAVKSATSTTNNIIPNSSKKVNIKFSDRDYSYDELVAKDDLNGIVVEKKQQVKLSANGNIDADWVVNEVKKKCKILKQNASATTYYTKVPDIDNNVEIIKKGITHGFMKSVMDKNKASSDKDILNARVCLELPKILQNSIEVNRSSRDGNIDIPFAHVMIGTVGLEDVNGNIDYYAVRFVIEERINQPPVLVEAGVLGKLHAVNAKKIGTPHVQVTKNGVALARSVTYTYNIAQFLEDVKIEFNDTFSEDVYQKLAMTRNVNKFSKELLFSDRDDISVYDIIGEKERLLEENKKLDVDAQNLKGIMGNEEIANKRFLGLANYLKKISGSNIDSAVLANKLKDAYTSLQASETLLWNDVFTKTYDIAESIMNKDLGVSAEYFRKVMHEIRKDRISLSEEQRARVEERFGSYGNFHKYVFGRANVTKDGTPLADVWKTWSKKYPALFEENASGAEQIDGLVDAVDALKTTSSVMDEYEYFEAIRHLSTEIYNQFWNIATDHAAVDKAKSYKAEHRALMENLRKDYEKRQKDIATHPVGETALKYESLLRKARETKKKEVALAKKRGRERMDKYKENAERKTRVQRITANALFLNEMLTKNSKDKHVPEILKNPVTALLQAIDFSSKRLIDNGEPTQKDISLSRALSEVKDMMVKATNAHDDLVELYGHGLDEEIKAMVKSVDNIIRTVGDNEFILNKMTLTDLKTLDKMVRTIRHAVNKLNKFHTVNHAKGIANLSQESVLYLDSLGKGKIYDGRRGKMKKILNWNNALPYYAFKRYGSGGMKVYEALQDGWDKFSFNIKKIVDYADEVYTSNEVKEWSEEVKTFKVLIPASEMEMLSEDYVPKYQEVKLTVPQIMSIYCLNKREQARKHLYQGGIRVADFKDKKGNIVSQSEGIIFTENDVQIIFDSLTERQKVVADKLQEFMNTVCADWGNDVSMARFGYKAFGEENYFPIQSDKNTRSVHDATEQPNRLFKLLNMSFTKSLDDGAKNRIVISDIFDVFAQHASDMAKYNSLALPVLDAFKWYNYTEEQDAAGGTFQTNGVQQSIENAFGEDGQKYFTTFLEDINGQQEVSRDTLGQGFFTNAKIAAVGANLRVMLLQPTSYIRAGVMIDNKYLVKALVHKPKTKSAETHCGIALWKSMGYYDTNIQRGVEAQIKHNDTWKDKAVNLSMKGAEIADKITWGYLWNACELEVRDKRKDLKVGSEEFYIQISKRLREIIYATQVVDSTMTRSQMMRSADRFDKMLTAFSSEPTLAYNMLQDAYMGLHLDARRIGKKEAWKKNGKRMARIVAAYTMTNALAALIESGFDAFRDDEEEELDMLTFMRLYLTNFASDMSITGKLPYIKELHSAIKGFGSSRSDTQWMENFVYAIRGWYKVFNGNGNATTTIKNSIQAASELSGLPFYNAYRDLMATLNKLDLFTAEDLNEMFEDFLD